MSIDGFSTFKTVANVEPNIWWLQPEILNVAAVVVTRRSNINSDRMQKLGRQFILRYTYIQLLRNIHEQNVEA